MQGYRAQAYRVKHLPTAAGTRGLPCRRQQALAALRNSFLKALLRVELLLASGEVNSCPPILADDNFVLNMKYLFKNLVHHIGG